MLSRISNTASKEQIEIAMDAKFDYGNLYIPMEVINGMKETSLCLVTANAIDKIQFGIWGILPMHYKQSWKDFQSVKNTLDVKIDTLRDHVWLFEAFNDRRCLIMSTGFYTSLIKKGKMYASQNKRIDDGIFCYAGIYNILDDGFITFSILCHTDTISSNVLGTSKPIIIKKEHYKKFLKKGLSIDDLYSLDLKISPLTFKSFPVSKKIYKN